MRNKSLQLLIVLILFNTSLFAQNESRKELGLEVNSWFAYNKDYAPFIPKGIVITYKSKSNEFLAGTDIYQLRNSIGKQPILGVTAGYKLDISKHLFFSANLHWCRYSEGFVKPGNWHSFNPGNGPYSYYDIKRKQLLAIVGIGANWKLLKKLDLYILFGGGHNFYQIYNAGNIDFGTSHSGYNYSSGNHVLPTAYLKAGINFSLWKK